MEARAQLADVIPQFERANHERTGALAEAIGARARVAELERAGERFVLCIRPTVSMFDRDRARDCFRAALARGKS
jgi:hypothetical protein